KFTFDSGSSTWTYQYTIPVGNNLGVRQMTVDFDQAPPVIYASTCVASNTNPSIANSLVKVQDNGLASTTTVWATAGPNQTFRGVRFAPIADAPAIIEQPASRTNATGTTATFAAGVVGSDPRTYQWVKNGTTVLANGGNISGADTATLVFANVSH